MRSLVRKVAVLVSFIAVLGAFGAAAYWFSYKDERNLSKALSTHQGFVAQSFFSPDDDLRSLLISLIDAEKEQISFAIYTLTDRLIAEALLRAQKRGVKIEGLVDRSYGQDRYSKVCVLANAHMPIYVYQTSSHEREAGLMHNKFMLFAKTVDNKELVWTGSYNFTKRATEKNEENVVIIENKSLYEAYKKYFERLKRRSLQISGPCVQEK